MKKHHVPKDEMEKRAAHALAQVRMTGYEKHLPSQLSGGQQQRVAIARALVSSDDVIVLDEPITNLDAKLREEMLVEIRQIQKAVGTTIIYITHDQEAALQLCDKMAIMDRHGALCQIGTDEDVILRPANRFVFEFIGISNFIPLEKTEQGVYLNAGTEKFPLPVAAPEGMDWSKGIEMGIRPMDIGFDPNSPIKGKVLRAVFLGSQYDYNIQLGSCELRVQRNTLDTLQSGSCEQGDEIGLTFLKHKFYYREQEANV
jgi:iron(III) transport system ATP-binding protein